MNHAIPTDMLARKSDASSSEMMLRVGDLAKQTSKTVRALHHYEGLGLLKPAGRSEGGYRMYAQDAVERVHWISKLQSIGLSLSKIRDHVVALGDEASAPLAMAHMRQLFEQKLHETREQLSHLAKLESELDSSLQFLETCRSCANEQTTKDACQNCSQQVTKVVHLIAGFQLHHG